MTTCTLCGKSNFGTRKTCLSSRLFNGNIDGDWSCKVSGKNILSSTDEFNKSFIRHSARLMMACLTLKCPTASLSAVFLRDFAIIEGQPGSELYYKISINKDIRGWDLKVYYGQRYFAILPTYDQTDFTRQLHDIIDIINEKTPSTN